MISFEQMNVNIYHNVHGQLAQIQLLQTIVQADSPFRLYCLHCSTSCVAYNASRVVNSWTVFFKEDILYSSHETVINSDSWLGWPNMSNHPVLLWWWITHDFTHKSSTSDEHCPLTVYSVFVLLQHSTLISTASD